MVRAQDGQDAEFVSSGAATRPELSMTFRCFHAIHQCDVTALIDVHKAPPSARQSLSPLALLLL